MHDVIVFLYEAVILVWNEVVIWNSQIINWMQLASILELPVNINCKDATRICTGTPSKYNSKRMQLASMSQFKNTCLNLEEEFLNLKLPIGLQETILIYIAAE